MPGPIARLVKDGEERLAHTRAELVQLRYDGWREVKTAVQVVRSHIGDAPQELGTSLTLGDDEGDDEGDES